MRKQAIVVISALIISLLASCSKSPTKDNSQLLIKTNILNATFSGFDNSEVRVSEGEIVSLGNADIDLGSSDSIVTGFAYPGFIDAHCHFVGYAKGLTEANLFATKSFDEVLMRLKDFRAANPSLEVVYGRGWDQNDWEDNVFPDNIELNILFTDVPVILTRIDGHAVLVNEKALEVFNINKETKVEGGIVESKNGVLTGILVDNASSLIEEKVDFDLLKLNLLTAEQNCFAVGLTTLDDAGLNLEMIQFLDSLQKSEELKIKLYVMASDNPENFHHFMENGPYLSNRMNVRSFKFYSDGALGSRGACLLHGYSDDKDNYGLMLSTEDHFRQSAELLMKNGFQMNTHAIGDSANRVLLNVYKDVLKGKNDKRWRIEHAQVVSDGDMSLFEEYSVLPSVQPTHATSDMYWAEDRLGHEHIADAYAYQELLNMSGVLPLGTDFPVEQIDPLKTFYAAVVRKDASGYPEEGFQMENAISRSDALKGMTLWAAYSNFEENEKGSIEIGKKADFTVLDTDLLTCSPEEILKAKVLYTVINGEIVYENKNP
jgi:predicted amidohydrolase YtcJ